ncbi:MAG: DUF1569 domain-containing protein [Thermonemataceae bacterium]|nr:DUF1569 domain-containing protein [Thermonemataceae bacterium]
MKKLEELLKDLENYIPLLEKSKPTVSNGSVAWHIEHSLLVVTQIVEAVKTSKPETFSNKFNFSRLMVFTLKKIPRGKAKAPKVVLPTEHITSESLREHLGKALEKIKILPTLPPKSYFTHPVFGNLDVKNTEKMLAIHTKHHTDIIKDIIA